jgi:hypothetical protein
MIEEDVVTENVHDYWTKENETKGNESIYK